jgi:hypothetical protein
MTWHLWDPVACTYTILHFIDILEHAKSKGQNTSYR